MISRRNIRVKVLQTLYTLECIEDNVTVEQAVQKLGKSLDQTRDLLVFLIHLLTEVARYAETDARLRAGKHLPSQEDMNVNTRLAGNELLWKILEDKNYLSASDKSHPERYDISELVRKLYYQLTETPEYQEYIQLQERNKKGERKILEFIFNDIILPSEDVDSFLEEHFMHWNDDADTMQQLVMNYLHKPGSMDFKDLISGEKMKFAKDLLKAALEKKELCLDMIRPRLKNWDPDRIALLDMLMMRLGVCEFLFFETIPTKVTINEYIDLAKAYSTPQSGHFVNGILDNIHKDLTTENKIQKVAFKKQNN